MSRPSRNAASATSAHRRKIPSASCSVLDRVGHEAEVRERDLGGVAVDELVQRGDRQIEVEVGRRSRRPQHAGVGQPHAHGVARRTRCRSRESCSARWCFAWPGESTVVSTRVGLDDDVLAVLEHVDALGARRVRAARRASRADRRRPCRRSARAASGSTRCRAPFSCTYTVAFGKRLGHIADTAGMVEVDVRHGDTGEIRRGPRRARRARRAAPRSSSGCPVSTSTGAVALDEVAGGHAVPATEQRVDLDHAVTDPRVHAGALPAVLRAAIARGQYGGTP